MGAGMRVELQAEVDGRRDLVFPLVSTAGGLHRWLDEADLDPKPGAGVRLRLREAIAIGRVIAVDPPQHVSIPWDWEAEPLGALTVVSFDLIDHGPRTHLTLRHVGFRSAAQVDLHDALWRYWFARLVAVARGVARDAEDAVRSGGASASGAAARHR